jgi:hypothetical protein
MAPGTTSSLYLGANLNNKINQKHKNGKHGVKKTCGEDTGLQSESRNRRQGVASTGKVP